MARKSSCSHWVWVKSIWLSQMVHKGLLSHARGTHGSHEWTRHPNTCISCLKHSWIRGKTRQLGLTSYSRMREPQLMPLCRTCHPSWCLQDTASLVLLECPKPPVTTPRSHRTLQVTKTKAPTPNSHQEPFNVHLGGPIGIRVEWHRNRWNRQYAKVSGPEPWGVTVCMLELQNFASWLVNFNGHV